MPRLPASPPAHLLNGLAVAAGVACVHLLISALAGPQAAQLAVAGAVCASLADGASTVRRNAQQVAAAGVLAVLAALVVAWLVPWPALSGLGVGVLTFLAMMVLAWGPRAGPASFAAVLSLVFAMAVPEAVPLHLRVLWPAAGALCFAAWSVAATALLQRRYRTLALAAAVRAMARLLRSRAAMLEGGEALPADGDGRLRTLIGDEAVLAERLQTARNLLFAAPDSARARRQNAMLLRVIELRDTLLASRLDLELVGDDDTGRFLRERLASGLRQVALALDEADASLRSRRRTPPVRTLPLRESFDDAPVPPADARDRLVPLLATRLQRLADEALALHALLRGSEELLPLSAQELQLFVAPEGWPLAALRAQLSLQSPVLRHAVRAGLALGCAYALGRVLPWASHPHWLVLSVAVVLRGNLEQTLSRRNARVAGTLLGCLVVLALARAPMLQPLAFLLAVGVAHAFINVRYLVTAIAATVMALLQAHSLAPEGGFSIVERLADTVLGALLAWGFSYVLPSWERRSLPRAVGRTLKALREYAQLALQPGAARGVPQRLARLQAYDALGSMAAALQRSVPEPGHVRLPLPELAQLLDHAHRLMAHLSVVRLMLVQRAEGLRSEEAAVALHTADAALQAQLVLASSPAAEPPAPGLQELPEEPPADEPLPWLQRRLQVTVHDAYRVGRAARALLGQVKRE